MSLRKRLICLLAALAVFAVIASYVTVYGTRLHVEDAIATFQQSMNQAGEVDRINSTAHDQLVRLHNVIDQRQEANALYRADRDAFFMALEGFIKFASNRGDAVNWDDMLETTKALQREFDHCLRLVDAGQADQARSLLTGRIEADLMATLDKQFTSVRMVLDEERRASVNNLVATNTQVLILAVVVAVMGAGMVLVGTTLIRRWIMLPITRLQGAVEEFSKGNLHERVRLESDDELGALGDTLNHMAASLVQAESNVRVSETKHRSLFENLRDALIICNANGVVVEAHDSETQLLGLEGLNYHGRHILDVWPSWRSGAIHWTSLIAQVMNSGSQYRDIAVPLKSKTSDGLEILVDLIAYPVEYGTERNAALVLRDVTTRELIEEQARRAEAMEATVTFARGIAHDFTNLLTSATGTLAHLAANVTDPRQLERVNTAATACRQAAALAARLRRFAANDAGRPEVLGLAELIHLTLTSFDESVLRGIKVDVRCDWTLMVYIDRDHMTQILLNLILNACDAMPDGGELRITGEIAPTDATVRIPPTARNAVLTVTDTGCGMSPDVKQRIFEPFYSTKARQPQRGRGLGLAVTLAAVRNANGQIHVDSRPGAGTSFRVHIPLEPQVWASNGPSSSVPDDDTALRGVLVVADNRANVMAWRESLAELGCSIIVANSVEEARSKYAELSMEDLCLVVVDVDAPTPQYTRLVTELADSNPKLRFIVTSEEAKAELPRELESRITARMIRTMDLAVLTHTVSAALALS